MDFNSLVFLGFFCAVAVLNYVLPRFLRPVFLLAASYAFYLYEPKNASLVALLIAATVITWASGLAIGRLENKWAKRGFLALSLLTCMGTLFFYKYYNFFGEVFSGGRFRPLELVAPLGLSYFTFQSLGYVLDVFMGKQEAEKNPIRYALFVSFFPAIVTGPIEQAGVLLPQIAAPRRFDYDRCAGGLFRMLWGYVKKMVIADNLGLFVGQIYARPGEYGGPYLAAAALLFALQLYMDFSGCCDVAIGAARVLGYDLTENFRSPFLAPTFRELWRRWHMSLTGWFRRYVYIPLGGNRKGKGRQIFNLFIVWLLTGIWHGANWNFICWGLYYFALLMIEKLFLLKHLEKGKIWPHVYTLFFVVVGWAMFVGNEYGVEFGLLFQKLFSFSGGVGPLYALRSYGITLAISILCCTEIPQKLWQEAKESTASRVLIVAVLFLISIAYIIGSDNHPFLYFNF